MTDVPEVRTDRLLLRGPVMTDFPPFREFWLSDRSALVGGPLDEVDAWRRFLAEAGQWMLTGIGWWTVEEQKVVVGTVGAHRPLGSSAVELGWVLYDGAEGRGIATEAARAARDWMVAAVAPARVVSTIPRANAGSIRVAERLGARLDAAADPGEGLDAYVHPPLGLSPAGPVPAEVRGLPAAGHIEGAAP